MGNLEIHRDWGWAPEYVDAMWRMLQQDQADDFVIATGQSHSLQEFVDHAFRAFSLDWRDHVVIDRTLFRPAEIMDNRGDARKAQDRLGWTARCGLLDIVRRMAESEQHTGSVPFS